ncbi:transcriptional activator DEMETER-like [Panicum miliaceum]|uniref:Transcriptional activator DEMETER-like n=1 Tax=Panicum miliaceum TaxID=4540 RepID=A0A3L6QG14_PANMI|nr:transcriptional activator DEMETER-like [Panicum miliaceum]
MAAVAEAEAEAAADLGPRLGISPATPDIVRKPDQQSRTTCADGSCCTTLFTGAVTAPAAGSGKAESDGLASAPSPVQEQSQSAAEDLGEVDCAPVSTQESSTLPPLMGESFSKVEQQQEEGVASVSDAGGAASVPTPEKVEPTPRRRWKKSTKGVLRFKVVKDKVMKPKMTPKMATPRKVKKDKQKRTPEDSSQHGGAGSSNSARRKLDLDSDSSQSKTCFSRAKLMDNLKCLAKSHGLSVQPTWRTRSKRGRKRQLMVPYQGTLTGASSSALVPLWGSGQLDIACHGNHGKKLWNKVLGLTEETLRVCDVLAKWDRSDSESFEGFDIGSGPDWDQTRHMFEKLADIFIAAVLDLMGPRKFSPWGGSVIDSVVGTFLTQNVADNLSSHAFMNLAAKFPSRKRCHKAEDCSNTAPSVDDVDENFNQNEASDTFDSVGSDFYEYIDSEEEDGHGTEIKGHYGEEYSRLIESFIANLKEKGISTWDSDLMNLVKDKSGNPICTERTLRKFIASLRPVRSSIWKELQEEAYGKGYSDGSRTGTSDAVDWESVLHAPIAEVAKCIEVRGQHYILALRIQVFLMHVKNAQDGSFDLDWLRYISREKAKNFLLSIHGIGEKSADCIRLLSLRHKAFPVDVNVARIVTRLGWVKLQPLNGAEFHLINSYPIMRDVQRYLWPRLCTIDKEKLYELHCLMITFGKVMCTKINPNCSACPFSANCKYYSSLARCMGLKETSHPVNKGSHNFLFPGTL